MGISGFVLDSDKFLKPRDGWVPYVPTSYEITDQYFKHSDLVGCSHEWINVGFHFDKHVCKKCNKDKI